MSASPSIIGPSIIGIDFGTTNSVVAVLQPDGTAQTRQAPGLDVFRTVLCFWTERGALRHAAGPRAVAAYLDDPEGTRLIMSMKTYLAQRSFSSTQVMGRPFTLEALVALFLRGLLADQGSDGPGLEGARIVAGRPVRFAGDLADDALGEARLRAWRCCRDRVGGARALAGVAGSSLSDPGCHLALQAASATERAS